MNTDYKKLTDKELENLTDPTINKGGIPFKAVQERQRRFREKYVNRTVNSNDGPPIMIKVMSKGKNWFVTKNYMGIVIQDRVLVPGTFPMDNHLAVVENEEDAVVMAAAHDLLDALLSIENDDSSIPQAIWDMRNKAISKALNIKS